MKILVTGGLGFIGANLIERLLQDQNNYIYCIDNNFTGDINNKLDSKRVEYLYGDTRDIQRIMGTKLVEVVYHLAEYSRIVTSFNVINLVHDFNCKGTFAVLEYCRSKKAKLVYAASSSKFGHEGNQHLSPYAWFKAKNVELVKNYGKWFDLNYSIAYFYNVYGPRQIMSGKYSAVIGRFLNQLENGQPLTVVQPGTQKRDFTHVEDIVDGLILLTKKGNGKEFQFGTGENYTMLEIASAFKHAYTMVPERQGERFEGKADVDETAASIGWKAKHNVIMYIREESAYIRGRKNGK